MVETRFGYHVIKVEERKAAAVRTLDEVRDDLRNGLEARKYGAEVSTLLKGLRKTATIVAPEVPAAPAGE